jgi:hypothetical protein
MAAHFRPGDCVIYRKPKLSTHPGPHAQDIQPARHGDTYTYCVPKFYRVVAVQPDHTIVVRTRRGRQRTLAVPDAALVGAALLRRPVSAPWGVNRPSRLSRRRPDRRDILCPGPSQQPSAWC